MSPARTAYVERLGEETREHRRARRKAHVLKSAEQKHAAKLAGYSEGYAEDAGRWHRSRARGQEERPERALSCGEDAIRVTCADCGNAHEQPGKCRLTLWCVRCRSALASQKRAQFLASRQGVLCDAIARGLARPDGTGRWRERLFTLTFPHLPGQSIGERIAIAFATWRRFLRELNRWARKKDAKSLQWFRAFEWEPGSDGKGHPHFHVWLFSPYTDRDVLWPWIRSAYEAAAGVVADLVIFDVRKLSGGKKDAQEIIKYLTKDIDAHGALIDPSIFAQVYAHIDGKRLTQASSGFMAMGKSVGGHACECGSNLKNVVRVKGGGEQ